MKLTKSITVKTFALMAAAVLTVSSPLAVFAADQTSMNDQATEAAQKFYRAALEAGNDEETAMKIAQDAVIKTKKAIVQKKAEDISDGTVSDELTDEERQILDEVMKEDTAQSAAAASTESSETSAASTQSGADLQAQAESQNDAALYLSQAAAQAKDIQDAIDCYSGSQHECSCHSQHGRIRHSQHERGHCSQHRRSRRSQHRRSRRNQHRIDCYSGSQHGSGDRSQHGRSCNSRHRGSCRSDYGNSRCADTNSAADAGRVLSGGTGAAGTAEHRCRQLHRRIQQCPLPTVSCSPRSFTAKQATRAIPERSRLAMSL